jgi:hypothetical protein
MPGTPADESSGRDEDHAQGSAPDAWGEGWRLLPPSPEDWLSEDEWEEWAAGSAARCAEDEPLAPEEAVDPDDPSLPANMDIDVLMAEAEQAAAEQARATEAAVRAGTRRSDGRGGGRAGAPRPRTAWLCATVPWHLHRPRGRVRDRAAARCRARWLGAARPGRVRGRRRHPVYRLLDDELIGVICGLDRAEAAAAALRHAAVAELIRRRPPAPGYRPQERRWVAKGAPWDARVPLEDRPGVRR